MPNAKHKDISRIDSESTHGWNVRVRFQGKTKCKLFSDKKYGNRNSALIIAISWRNSTEKNLGKPRTDETSVTDSSTETGVVGITLNKKLTRYTVLGKDSDGKNYSSSFSIKKYGKEVAFAKACALRLKKKKKVQERLAALIITEKTCTKCNETKPLEEFGRNKRYKNGIIGHCKECRASYHRAHAAKVRKERPAPVKKLRVVQTKEEIAAKRKKYREEHKEELSAKRRERYQKFGY